MNTSNPTHTDPEELRLMQDTVKLGKNMLQLFAGSEAVTSAAGRALVGKIRQIDDHRAKASAPVVPERCEPPKELRHHKWHWLSYRVDVGVEPWQELWHFDGNDHWSSYGIAFGRDPISQAAEGWKWHSVASPSNPDIRQPTATAPKVDRYGNRQPWSEVVELADALVRGTDDGTGYALLSALIEMRRSEGRSIPGEQADIRQLPTDEAIDALQHTHLPCSTAADLRPSVYRAIVRNAISHFSPSVSPKRLGDDEDVRGMLLAHIAYNVDFAGLVKTLCDAIRALMDNRTFDFSLAAKLEAEVEAALDAIGQGKPPETGGQNTSTANGLGQENASQPAASAQQEPDDEALIRFLRRYDLEGGFYTRMLKDALARFSASISDDQLLKIRDYARTDSTTQYLTDARGVVGR